MDSGVSHQHGALPLRRMSRNVDDSGPLCHPQQGQGGPHTAHGGHHPEIEGGIPVRVVQLLETSGTRTERVDQYVEATPAFGEIGEGRIHLRGIGHVGGQGHGAGTAQGVEGGHRLVQGVVSSGQDCYRRALVGQTLGDGPAHTLRPPGHHRGCTVQPEIHRSSSTREAPVGGDPTFLGHDSGGPTPAAGPSGGGRGSGERCWIGAASGSTGGCGATSPEGSWSSRSAGQPDAGVRMERASVHHQLGDCFRRRPCQRTSPHPAITSAGGSLVP